MMHSSLSRPLTSDLASALADFRLGSDTAAVMALFAAGEQGWFFDNADLSTMFSDAGGTVPAVVDGPVVKQLDKSGNGNHRTLTNATLRLIGGRYSLQANGTTTSAVTAAIDFTGASKITVWAGARKLTDAARATLVELGTGGSLGSFQIEAPATAGPTYLFSVKDSTTSFAHTHTGAAAPISNVITLQGNLDGATPALIARVNAVQSYSGGAAAARTFGNLALYFFRRAGTSLPFNGHEYISIGRGAASSAAQIAAGEALCNARAGAY